MRITWSGGEGSKRAGSFEAECEGQAVGEAVRDNGVLAWLLDRVVAGGRRPGSAGWPETGMAMPAPDMFRAGIAIVPSGSPLQPEVGERAELVLGEPVSAGLLVAQKYA